MARYALFILLILLLALVGYIGYAVYPRFNLPPVTGAGLLILAAGAGIASFFSPCSFPLLITLLAKETGAASEAGKPKWQSAFTFAVALASGAVLFLVLSGGIFATLGEAFFAAVTFTSLAGRILRTLVGLLLVSLGLIQLRLLPNPFRKAWEIAEPLMKTQARLRRSRPLLGFGLYGFGYILSGFGWTGPILAGLAGHAFASGGAVGAFTAFLTAGLVISLLVFIMAFTVTFAQEKLVHTLRSSLVQVRRWAGWLLILVGIWLIVLAIWANIFTRIFPV